MTRLISSQEFTLIVQNMSTIKDDSNSIVNPKNKSGPVTNVPIFKCDMCNSNFDTRRGLIGHNMGKHKALRCSICGEVFDKKPEIGRHKIEIHGLKREQLGWGLTAGWNRGKPQETAFGKISSRHGAPDFMRRLNNPEMLERKKLTRRYHEDMVLKKELELRAQGFRTFCTSNYTRHSRIPDIIAISPDGRVVAVEMETIRRYKSSVECLTKKYTPLLLKEGFFDDIVVEGFIPPLFQTESSNMEQDTL